MAAFIADNAISSCPVVDLLRPVGVRLDFVHLVAARALDHATTCTKNLAGMCMMVALSPSRATTFRSGLDSAIPRATELACPIEPTFRKSSVCPLSGPWSCSLAMLDPATAQRCRTVLGDHFLAAEDDTHIYAARRSPSDWNVELDSNGPKLLVFDKTSSGKFTWVVDSQSCIDK